MTGSPLTSDAFDGDGGRPLDRDEHVPQREAPFVLHLRLLRRVRDDGIDEHAILAVVHEDEHAPQHPDLRSREPDTVRLVHQRGHPLDETLEVLVERLDLPCPHAQDGVAVLPDAREGDEAARFPLEVALLTSDSSWSCSSWSCSWAIARRV